MEVEEPVSIYLWQWSMNSSQKPQLFLVGTCTSWMQTYILYVISTLLFLVCLLLLYSVYVCCVILYHLACEINL